MVISDEMNKESASEETPPQQVVPGQVESPESENWKEKYLRKMAEFDNFRRRTRLEQEQSRAYVTESVVTGLLPVLDDFDRMLIGMAESNDPYRKAVEMIFGKLRLYLQSFGVERFESIGKPFNPAEHEALSAQPTADFPPGTVINVIAPGYKMNDRVLRHAQVVVSSEATDTANEVRLNTEQGLDQQA